ncbi:MAG: tetratricopeptide repeat protein [Psychrobium sp.]
MKLFISACYLFTSIALGCFAKPSHAISVELPTPTFQFELSNIDTGEPNTKLASDEYDLSLKLKPLLDNKDYLAAIDVLAANTNPQKSTGLLLIEGQIFLAAKKSKLAEKALLAVAKKAPEIVRVHKTLAALYLGQKRIKQAQTHLIKAIELGVRDPQFFGQLAYINLNQNEPWSAIAGYQQALLLEPHNAQWRHGLLFALQQAGNHQAALNMVNELLSREPKNKDLWLQRAQINLALEQSEKALTSMEMALRLGEKNTSNLLSTAQLHLTSGSKPRAADLLINIGNQGASHFSQIHSAVNWLINEDELKQANRVLSGIKDVNKLPKSQQSQYYAALGSVSHHSNIKRAVKHYQRALKLDPNSANVLLKLGEYYQGIEQYSRAELYYQRAQVFKQTIKPALASLAQIALNQAQYDKALAYLQKLKPLSSNPLNIDKNIAILKRMQTQKCSDSSC